MVGLCERASSPRQSLLELVDGLCEFAARRQRNAEAHVGIGQATKSSGMVGPKREHLLEAATSTSRVHSLSKIVATLTAEQIHEKVCALGILCGSGSPHTLSAALRRHGEAKSRHGRCLTSPARVLR